MLGIVALLAAGCGQAGTDEEAGGEGEGTAQEGGTLVIGAEQEPDCLDLIGSCSGAAWGYWTGYAHTIPRSFDILKDKYQPGAVLDGEPELEPGPPMKVTYKINPDAVWSDGEPITSEDIHFTWDAIVNGKDVYSTTGYNLIEDIDTSDPKTAVVTFKEPYSAWQDLFTYTFGILPKHILEGKDRNKEMVNGFKWSGGPWIMEAWKKGQEISYVPNEKFWGEKPKLDRVVFRFITDSSAELQAFRTGQVQMIHPQQQIGLGEQLQNLQNAEVLTESTSVPNYEGFYFNWAQPPLDNLDVRKAIAYSIDREAIVERISRPIDPEAEVLQAMVLPSRGDEWYEPVWDMYKPDKAKVQEHMTRAGYTRQGNGPWTKGGKPVQLEVNTTAGNEGRELIEQLAQSQLRENGFELKINNTEAGTLFGQWLPQGQQKIGMYAQVQTLDPGWCSIFCSDQIPGPANNNAGQNFQRVNNPQLDAAWKKVDAELDEAARAEAVKEANRLSAEQLAVLPLYLKLSIIAYNSQEVSGPIDHAPTMGPFWNMNLWSLTS